ncbi:MAG: riboflavin kinase/FMN adenylyltransferase, partial [Porticoccaceae bacterium]
YEYFLTGTVFKGQQLGRTIGFPTANLKIKEDYKLIPKNGVYIVKSIINQKTVFGMMNIGFNPTVDGESLSIEIHYFNFNSNLYDQQIAVSIIQYIRPEQKFKSVDLLKVQLEKDKNFALAYLS